MDTKYHEQYIRFGLKVQYYRKNAAPGHTAGSCIAFIPDIR